MALGADVLVGAAMARAAGVGGVAAPVRARALRTGGATAAGRAGAATGLGAGRCCAAAACIAARLDDDSRRNNAVMRVISPEPLLRMPGTLNNCTSSIRVAAIAPAAAAMNIASRARCDQIEHGMLSDECGRPMG